MLRRVVIAGLAVLSLAAVPSFAQAQETEPETVPIDKLDEAPAPLEWEKRGITIRAGATWSGMRGELDFGELGTRGFTGGFGFAAGVSLELPLSPKVSVQPEVQIVRKFSEIDLGGDFATLKTKLSVNYVEFPALLKWYPGGHDGAHVNFVLGATPGLKIAATREIRRGDQIEDVPADDLVTTFDWGITVGLGFEFHELFSALTVDLRYNHGMTDIGSSEDGSEARWSVLYMLVGVKF